MNTTGYMRDEIQKIAAVMQQQIGTQALMAQAAREFTYGPMLAEDDSTQLPGFAFTAKPTTRLVRVHVLLDPSDTYRVVVRNPKTHKVTWSRTEVYADDLRELILFLDRELGDLIGDYAMGYRAALRDALEIVKKNPSNSHATEQQLEAARAKAWEEGKQAFIEYTQGARRKVPYPTNPYRSQDAPGDDLSDEEPTT